MNDLLVFAKNILISAPLIVVLILIGLKSLKFNRFYYGEYNLFRARLSATNNSHPSIMHRNVNVLVGAACAIIITGLNEIITNKTIVLYLVGIVLLILAIWDVVSLPSQIKKSKEWFNQLSSTDKAAYTTYKNFRRQIATFIVIFFIYIFIAIRFLP